MKSKAELFTELDVLKVRLDAHRPLPPDVVSQIREDMRVRFTYHSNAIEGNTLTMSETKAVLEDGITIGGKSLKEYLEAVGHSHAIDYMEALVQKDEALTERTLKEIHYTLECTSNLYDFNGARGFGVTCLSPVQGTSRRRRSACSKRWKPFSGGTVRRGVRCIPWNSRPASMRIS